MVVSFTYPLGKRVDYSRKLVAATLFSDHMVLQRNTEIRVFGWANDGWDVQACLSGEGVDVTAHAIVDPRGRFTVTLPPLDACGPLTLTLSSEQCEEKYEFHDVWVGEVWVAAGQSNMEFRLKDSTGGKELCDNPEPDWENIRYFATPEIGWFDPQFAQREKNNTWQPVNKESISGNLSAVGFHMARVLHEKLGIAVGLLECYVGGSSASSWISTTRLKEDPRGQRYIDEYAEQMIGVTGESWIEKTTEWQKVFDQWNADVAQLKEQEPGVSMERITEKFGPCPWPPPAGPYSKYRPGGTVESMLERIAGYPARGVLWYQGSADENRSEDYRWLLTELITSWRELWQSNDMAWIIGQLPRFVDIDEWRKPRNPSTWSRLRAAQMNIGQDFDFTESDLSSELTSNLSDELTGNLSDELTGNFSDDLTGKLSDEPQSHFAALYSEHEEKPAVHLSNVYCSVNLDQGEFNNLHPLDKRPVGERMAGVALTRVYSLPQFSSYGPRVMSVISGRSAQIGANPELLAMARSQTSDLASSLIVVFSQPVHFDHYSDEAAFEPQPLLEDAAKFANTEMTRKPSDSGFEVAGEDGIFYPAQAEIFTADHNLSVAVRSALCARPVAVRYGFRNWGPAPLFDEKLSPAAPFSTLLDARFRVL